MPNLFLGDSLDVLKTLPENSIDSLVTDPPAGIAFMGKSWDSDKGGREPWIAWMSEIMREALRVMKPGAHGLVWGLPRTSHWTATALENAGFEIRDVVTHLFGSGFPKSLDISKAIDKAAGAEREVIGKTHCGLHHRGGSNNFTDDNWKAENREGDFINVTPPSTPEAKQWSGFGTALKPAVEFYILIRKPLSEKTVAANVLKWGCGGINIDASRIGTEPPSPRNSPKKIMRGGKFHACADVEKEMSHYNPTQGRFPSHLVLDEEAASLLDEQSGISKSIGGSRGEGGKRGVYSSIPAQPDVKPGFGDVGGASRFYYVAKASRADKGEFNIHPTCKSTKLMEYLIKLITPPNGVVLDCFMGSGSTGVSAKRAGFQFVGIEKEADYFEIAEKRLSAS